MGFQIIHLGVNKKQKNVAKSHATEYGEMIS